MFENILIIFTLGLWSKKMNLIFLFHIITNLTFAEGQIFHPLKLDITKLKDGEKINKRIQDAIFHKQVLSEDYSRMEVKPSINGAKISSLKIRKGNIESFILDEDTRVLEFEIPRNFKISLLAGEYNFVDWLNPPMSPIKGARYRGITFAKKRGIRLKRGAYPANAFSGELQIINGARIFENQPILFDQKGDLKIYDNILHYGKRYYFKDIAKDGKLPITPMGNSYNKFNSYFRVRIDTADSFLGNNCQNCEYVLCEGSNSLYVYHIDGVIEGKSKIQGNLADSKVGSFYYYRNGNSTKPFIDEHDGAIPFKYDCTFNPSADITPERVKSLKNY